MSVVSTETLVKWLRAAGEPSRLRLLTLCAHQALSVSDLAHALGQSDPRISRHLKILCEAGLIERLPQGQWVHYRVASEGAALSFVRGLLAQADARDPQLVQDRSAARAAISPALPAHGGESRLGRALAAFVSAGDAPSVHGSALVLGAAHPEVLERASRTFGHVTSVAPSRRAAQAIRAYAAERGFECHVVRAADSAEGGAKALLRSGACFDAVVLDHPGTPGEALARLLEDVRHLVKPGARLCIFEAYDSFEAPRERVVEHPLARLRRLLSAAGLVCERLSPIEADGEHVLAALARCAPAGQVPQNKGVG
jgi:ArsR family transcriptional regulator